MEKKINMYLRYFGSKILCFCFSQVCIEKITLAYFQLPFYGIIKFCIQPTPPPPPSPHPVKYKDQHYLGEGRGEGANVSMMLILL